MLIILQERIQIQLAYRVVLIIVVYLESHLEQNLLFEIYKLLNLFNESVIIIMVAKVEDGCHYFCDGTLIPPREVGEQFAFR